ncbi:hypothetical protein [Paraburkholderia panacisoli]|nr:hypothetical protein [Paraburkholderia panacisoli]
MNSRSSAMESLSNPLCTTRTSDANGDIKDNLPKWIEAAIADLSK